MLLLQRIILILALSFIGGHLLTAQQDTTRILFLGNSYTAYNNLPTLVQNMAAGPNHVVIVDQHTPGGYTFNQHIADSITRVKIRQENWDFVVLQEQSQIPTIDAYRSQMVQNGRILQVMIRSHHPCANLVFYGTWGRQNGGQQCDPSGMNCSPVFTDFGHMQDSLTAAYLQVTEYNSARLAPVGEAWRNMLDQGGVLLHQADESHPNLQGSYLAACVLYNTIWKERSLNNSYTATLPTATAQRLQMAADTTVYGSTTRWDYEPDSVSAAFIATPITGSGQTEYNLFMSSTTNPHNTATHWFFSDGGTESFPYTSHRFSGPPPYWAMFVVSYCGLTDTVIQNLTPLNSTSIEDHQLLMYPNPTTDEFYISGAEAGDQVLLYNVLGQLVFQQTLERTDEQLSIQSLPTGPYQVVLHRPLHPIIPLGLLKKLGRP